MKKMIFYILSFAVLLIVLNAIWPFVNSYFINSELKKAALYGTKHSIQETHDLLVKNLKEKDLVYDPEKLSIEKNEHKTVSISLSYEDEIKIFGITLKKLQFDLSVKEKHIDAFL